MSDPEDSHTTHIRAIRQRIHPISPNPGGGEKVYDRKVSMKYVHLLAKSSCLSIPCCRTHSKRHLYNRLGCEWEDDLDMRKACSAVMRIEESSDTDPGHSAVIIDQCNTRSRTLAQQASPVPVHGPTRPVSHPPSEPDENENLCVAFSNEGATGQARTRDQKIRLAHTQCMRVDPPRDPRFSMQRTALIQYWTWLFHCFLAFLVLTSSTIHLRAMSRTVCVVRESSRGDSTLRALKARRRQGRKHRVRTTDTVEWQWMFHTSGERFQLKDLWPLTR